ncbi:hypothetical protein CMV_010456 [Castanea mollissima]|uniref:Large ribosomal subunit protein eL14 domain-containing protein n=1 Tax=Castanea mollissima TaxID=60419 RepID=A0A8J4VPM2_9ROSI|nr:hypothetical protein CMV_010456 [Castanea mollissima]
MNSKATKGGRKVIARRIARAGQELRLSILASGMGRMASGATLLMYSKALVDAPDVERSQMNFKRLSLTDIKIDIKRVPKKKELLDAMEKADVKKKWESSSWGRKLNCPEEKAKSDQL